MTTNANKLKKKKMDVWMEIGWLNENRNENEKGTTTE